MKQTDAIDVVKKSALSNYAESLIANLRPALRFELLYAEPETLGCTKLGGRPDLPKESNWPVGPEGNPLSFIGQFDLSQCQREYENGDLPREGLLSFFYDADNKPWGSEPDQAGSWCVRFAESGAKLTSQAFPKGLHEDHRYASVVLKPRFVQSLPSETTIEADKTSLLREIYVAHSEAYLSLCAELDAPRGVVKESPQMGGWPREEQNEMPSSFPRIVLGSNEPPRRVPNPFKPGEIITVKAKPPNASPTVKKLLSESKEWTLLLQLPSDADKGPGWMWGDVGKLYFWIPRASLKKRQFEYVWVILQCG